MKETLTISLALDPRRSLKRESRPSSKEKLTPNPGPEALRGADDEPFSEEKARGAGVLLAVVGAALTVLSAVLGDSPF